MAEQPWFKFFAADYLLDADVDAMPREAEALLVRMWCVCHREGYCPSDPATLARKTLCSLQYISQCKPHCEPFFELRQDGKLYSRRMEEEKARSEQARQNANKRYAPKSKSDSDSDSKSESKSESESESERGSAVGSANGSAVGTAAQKQLLPDWIPPENWQGFVEHRKKLRACLTPRSTNLIVGKLTLLRKQGYAPAEVLDQSVANGWKGIFELKGTNGHGNRAQQRTTDNLAALEAAFPMDR